MNLAKKIALLLCLISIGWAITANAQETSGWSASAQVSGFWCQSAKSCFISGNFGNPGSCASNQLLIDEGSLWGALDGQGKGNGGFDFVMSLVIISKVAGVPFKCYVNGCQSAQGTTYNRCVQTGLE